MALPCCAMLLLVLCSCLRSSNVLVFATDEPPKNCLYADGTVYQPGEGREICSCVYNEFVDFAQWLSADPECTCNSDGVGFCSHDESDGNKCWTRVVTRDDGETPNYGKLWTPVDPNAQRIEFTIVATGNARIILQHVDNDFAEINNPDHAVYEIVLADGPSVVSEIRSYKEQPSAAASISGDIGFHETKPKGFWISWADGLVQVGHSGNEFPFMSWRDNEYYFGKVNYFSVATTEGATYKTRSTDRSGGIWRWPCAKAETVFLCKPEVTSSHHTKAITQSWMSRSIGCRDASQIPHGFLGLKAAQSQRHKKSKATMQSLPHNTNTDEPLATVDNKFLAGISGVCLFAFVVVGAVLGYKRHQQHKRPDSVITVGPSYNLTSCGPFPAFEVQTHNYSRVDTKETHPNTPSSVPLYGLY